jgi:ribosomal protein L44E
MKMKIKKKVAYKVQCAPCKKIFDKTFEIEEGSENIATYVEAYCPFCDKRVTVTVQGKVVADKELLRKIDRSKKTQNQ